MPTKTAKIVEAAAAREKPPICAAIMLSMSTDVRVIITYAASLPTDIMLLSQ